jgi:ubiquinone/menaquinone biosynthesis C-methylase UbiE
MRLEYERDTKLKYQSEGVASHYDRSFRKMGIKNVRSWLVAWHERKIMKRAMAKLSHKQLTLADLPCGTGKLSDILLDKNTKVFSGDISAEMIAIAKGYYSQSRALPYFIQLDVAKCPFKSSIFDCVVALRLMHRVLQRLEKTY